MKKFISSIIAFGLLIAPMNAFAKDDVTEELALAVFSGLIVEVLADILLSADDNPVSP